MATWAGIFKKDSFNQNGATMSGGSRGAIHAMDPFRLRSLPNDDIYFWAKRIDNSRVVRQADPAARGEMASTLAAAAVLMVLAVSIIMPKAAWMLEGYKLEALKLERQTLLDQRRELEVREASLLSPERLAELAKASNLTSPGVDQIVHLDGRGDAALASNRPAAPASSGATTATIPADNNAPARNH